MKNPTDEELRITRWIDGELTDDDVKDLLNENPSFIEQKQSSIEVGALMKSALPAEEEVPYGDFFNQRILNRIENLQREDDAAETNPIFASVEFSLSRFLASLFSSQSMVLGGAAAMGIGMLCTGLLLVYSQNGRHTEVTSTYVPDEEFSASPRFDSASNAAVFDVEGMLTEGQQVAGYFPGKAEVEPLSGTTTIYSPDGKPMLMLTTDAKGVPTVHDLILTTGL